VERLVRRPSILPSSSPVAAERERLRASATRSFQVLREQDSERLRRRILVDIEELLDASAARVLEMGADGGLHVGDSVGDERLPTSALAMEAALLPRALTAEKSMVSNDWHRFYFDSVLCDLAADCERDGVVMRVFLVRAYEQTHGAIGVHWVGREPPSLDGMREFYTYLENAALAFALSNERRRIEAASAELREKAYRDTLTGLPNMLALEEQLEAYSDTLPFSALVLDFDGMREANNMLGYTEGGDVLIETVGRALDELAGPREFVARLHTAGDEFAVLLPEADADHARVRAETIEHALDTLEVPASHSEVYKGASVGWATRQPDETPGQTLGRATAAMRERKTRRAQATDPREQW
jgi:diguanylate cyclase (GGDEF)-like protein